MATPNIVPRADQEGGLGTEAKGWGKLFIDNAADGGTAAATITNLDIDKVALDINANNTSANVIDVVAGALSGGAGLYLNTANGQNDIKVVSSADTADYCTIGVTTNGATTLTTVDGGAAAANFEVAADGNITLDAAGNITLETGTTTANYTDIPIRKMPVSTTTDGNGNGDVVYFGTGSSVVGKIYHYKSDASWELADANTVANCDGLLAVALGTDPDVDGMLLRGMVTLIDIQGTEAVGDVLYLSESATGAADCVAPAGSGDIVRVIGYCLTTDDQIWFNPDNTYVELA